jgi:[ribosomal protein S5]-alanine N-acetyltransferase
MTGDLTIVAPRLKLRPTEPADAERFTEIQFNWNVIRMLRLANYPASLEAMTAWLAAHADERRAGTAFRFVVMFEDRVVGCADIDEIGAERGALGYWLDEAVWGRGLAVEAGSALMDWSFETLGLSGLDTGCASDNPASAAVLTRLGFQRAGEARL